MYKSMGDIDSIYVLNPAYFLRNDIHRAVIGSFDFSDMPDGMYEKNALHIVHPYTAIMLSYFDGERTLWQCIQEISKYFGIGLNETKDFVEKYINNDDPLCIKYGDNYIILPIYTLVEKGNINRTEIYNYSDFEIEGEVDINSIRLYKPVKVIVEMNFHCYTNCKYCYADRNNVRANKNISPDRLIALIHEMKNLNIPSLEINGGEVLMHPQIESILKTMSECGYHPFISTKIPLAYEQIALLKSLRFQHIQISLDSVNEDTLVEHLNVKKGYLKRIFRTMELLDEMGFDWQVNTVITKWNSSIDKEVKPLLNYLFKFKKLKSIKFSPMGFPMYKDKNTFIDMHASLDEIIEIKEFLCNLKNRNNRVELIFARPNCNTDYFPATKKQNFNSRSICSANQKGFVVLPNGEVTICEELYWNPNFIIGNIVNQSITDIWNSEKAKKLFYIDKKDIPDDSICKKCNNFVQCRHTKGVCWKMVIMAYGKEKWYYPDPSCPESPHPTINFCY